MRPIFAAVIEAGNEPQDLAASIREHFSGTRIELELRDRGSATQRAITFGS